VQWKRQPIEILSSRISRTYRKSCSNEVLASSVEYLSIYVFYMTMDEWNYRNMFVGKYVNERTVVRCCVCVDSKLSPD